MKEYRFYVLFYSNDLAVHGDFYSVFAKNYRSAHKQLLTDVSDNLTYDSFCVASSYIVNGKLRSAK